MVCDVGLDAFFIPSNGRDKVSTRPDFVAEKSPHSASCIRHFAQSILSSGFHVPDDLRHTPAGVTGDESNEDWLVSLWFANSGESARRQLRVSIPKLTALRKLRKVVHVMTKEQWNSAAFQLLHAHARHGHRADAPIPGHWDHILEAVALVTGVCS